MTVKYRVYSYSEYHKAWSKLDSFDTIQKARNQAKHCDKYKITKVTEEDEEWNFIESK